MNTETITPIEDVPLGHTTLRISAGDEFVDVAVPDSHVEAAIKALGARKIEVSEANQPKILMLGKESVSEKMANAIRQLKKSEEGQATLDNIDLLKDFQAEVARMEQAVKSQAMIDKVEAANREPENKRRMKANAIVRRRKAQKAARKSKQRNRRKKR